MLPTMTALLQGFLHITTKITLPAFVICLVALRTEDGYNLSRELLDEQVAA